MTPEQNLDKAMQEIRDEQVDLGLIEKAAQRTWSRIADAAGPATIQGCAGFRALMPDYRAGKLSEARSLLLVDHTHECVACRKALESAGRVIPFGGGEVQSVPAPRPAGWRPQWTPAWGIAAAMVVTLGLATWGIVNFGLVGNSQASHAVVQSVQGKLYRVTGKGLEAVTGGEDLPGGTEIRTARNSSAVVRLGDGTVVEMSERAGISVRAASSDLSIHLDRGSVIVQAAKRRAGHLYVITKDCRVAVTGTVFDVNSGIKGSRVSVIEGEVHVTESDGGRAETVLHPGDQFSSDSSMMPVPVSEEIAWSRNATEHLALLRELVTLKKQLETLPGPTTRYSSQIPDLLPAGTVLYVSFPNLGRTLSDANQIFHQRMQENAVLRDWWERKMHGSEASSKLDTFIDEVRAFSDYLGDEVVVTAAINPNGAMGGPVFLAEVKRGGFREFVHAEMNRFAADGKSPLHFIDEQPASASPRGLNVAIRDNFAAFAPEAESLAQIGAGNRFAGTPFHARIREAYRDGAGILFSADMGMITNNMSGKRGVPQPVGNIKYVVMGQKQNGQAVDTHAQLTFSGPRTGVFGWLARPSPMGVLDFFSPEALGVTAFAVNSPAQVIDDMLSWLGNSNPNTQADLAAVQSELGFDIRNDLAASLGSEFASGIDGAALPTPSWKFVVEVYDPQRLQWTLQKTVESANRKLASKGKAPLQMTQEVVGGRTFYTILWPDAQPVGEAHYVFLDSYMVAAPSRTLLDRAIQYRATGYTLPRSAAFHGALPQDGQTNFSALAYQNFGGALGSIFSGVMQSRTLTPEQQEIVKNIAAGSAPTLVAAYADEDRITIASASSFFGLNLSNLAGLSGQMGLFSLEGIRGSMKKGTK